MPECALLCRASNAIAAYSVRKVQWFSDWPRSNRSIGGRFSNFIFCDGQHRNAFDFDYMSEILLSVGFAEVEGAAQVQVGSIPQERSLCRKTTNTPRPCA